MRQSDIMNGGSQVVNGTNGVVDLAKNGGVLDPRLTIFGYTTETINMLLLPMFANK